MPKKSIAGSQLLATWGHNPNEPSSKSQPLRNRVDRHDKVSFLWMGREGRDEGSPFPLVQGQVISIHAPAKGATAFDLVKNEKAQGKNIIALRPQSIYLEK